MLNSLIRHKLSCCGNFITSDIPIQFLKNALKDRTCEYCGGIADIIVPSSEEKQ